MALETVLIIPDTHRPYHDEKAHALVVKVGKRVKPKHLIILGDYADFYAVSSHDKDPSRMTPKAFEAEVADVRRGLKDLASTGATNRIFIAGNHEDRLTRFVLRSAPTLQQLVVIPELLQLKQLGYKYVPYKSSYILGRMRYTHDVGPSGKHAAAKSMEAMGRNTVIGHCHRMEYVVQGTLDGERHVGISLGWLGDKDAIDYMHQDKVSKDWTLGFGIGYFDTETQYTTIFPTPILPGYHAIVSGAKVSL